MGRERKGKGERRGEREGKGNPRVHWENKKVATLSLRDFSTDTCRVVRGDDWQSSDEH